MPVDPRLNCAAEICCVPRPLAEDGTRPLNQEAHASRVSILCDLGIPEDLAHKASAEMVTRGIVFLSADLATAMREIAFPAGGA